MKLAHRPEGESSAESRLAGLFGGLPSRYVGRSMLSGWSPLDLLLAGLVVLFFANAVLLAYRQAFTIDEFQYAHAAWLISKGAVAYRDFFEVHLPLLYQAFAPLFMVLGDDPRNVLALRIGMLVFLVIALSSAAIVNRRDGRAAQFLTVLFLLFWPGWVVFATQIRPDPVALTFFLAALAMHYRSGNEFRRGFASGILLVLSVWASQKALFYGAVFGLVWFSCMAARHHGACLRFRGLLMGLGLGAAPIAAYLWVSDSWGAIWNSCFAWAAEHQRSYPGFPWTKYFLPAVLDQAWVLALAIIGIAATLKRWIPLGRERWGDPDFLLLASLPASFGSFALQRAPFPYSLLPFIAVAAVFAARGGALAIEQARERRVGWLPLGAVFLLLSAQQQYLLVGHLLDGNLPQLQVLGQINDLTDVEDSVYDNSGSYVSRPSAVFQFYTDAFIRRKMGEDEIRVVATSIINSGTAVMVDDIRTPDLPGGLRAFLDRYFQPYNGDIRLWGMRFQPSDGAVKATFLAVRAGEYFVAPAALLKSGELHIGRRRITGSVLHLEKGQHEVQYRGEADEFYILWMPRDGKRWYPAPGRPRSLSRLF